MTEVVEVSRPTVGYSLLARIGRGALCVAVVVAAIPSSAAAQRVGAARAGAPSWSAEKLPAGLGPMSGIACEQKGASARCVAVGEDGSHNGAVVVSGNGGRTWAKAKVPAGVGFLGNVACSSASRCWAAGRLTRGSPAVIATTDGGSRWRLETLPASQASFGPLGQISCIGGSCWVVQQRDTALLVTRDGGARWSVERLTTPCGGGLCAAFIPTDVAFVNGSDGYATGLNQCGGFHVTQCEGVVWRTTDGGRRWRIATTRIAAGDAISCIDARHCWVAAATFKTGEMYATADGGAHWSHQRLPRFVGYFNDIRCLRQAQADRCFAVGQNEKGTASVIVGTTDGGYHWQLDKTPSGTGALGAVSLIGTGGRAAGENSSASGPVVLRS